MCAKTKADALREMRQVQAQRGEGRMTGILECGCWVVEPIVDGKKSLIIYQYCLKHREQLFDLEKYGKLRYYEDMYGVATQGTRCEEVKKE